MSPTTNKPLSKAYLNQLVNLYSKIIDSGEDLDHLLATNRQQYNNAIGSNFTTDSGFKQLKVKLKALRKHSDEIEEAYRERGKGSLSNLSKENLREHSSIFLQFEPYEKKPELRDKANLKEELPSKIPKPDSKGSYGTFEIYDSKNDEYYYIKYKNTKDFNNKLRKLKDSIGKNLKYNFLGFEYYKSFIDDNFKDFVRKSIGAN